MADVSFSYTPQAQPACYPGDVNGMLALVAGGALAGTVPDNAGGGIIVSPAPPDSSLAHKVWLKTDAQGRPTGFWAFYQGNWRKVYSGVGIGEIHLYNGSGDVFDGSGLGIVLGDFDGWALCNGNHGTPNLVSHFIVAGAWNGSAWVTPVDGRLSRTEGGAPGPHIITGANLPQLHTEVYSDQRGGATPVPGENGHLIGGPADLPQTFWPVIETINSQNTEMPLPFFYAVAFMMFVGYA